MKQLQRSAMVALVAALTLLVVSPASATILEVGGAAKEESIAIKASLIGSLHLTDTFGAFAKHMH